jgi:4-hydroxy-tetrahydrodipicolinate synthase
MFSGSIVALVTPMTVSGHVDWQALERLVDWHVEAGTAGIVPVGTTGESPTLQMDEHKRVIEFTVRRAAGRIPVLAGTGTNSTAEAIELTEDAAMAGADASVVVTPYYNRPTQEGLYQHYKAIAEAVNLPMVLYNVPGRTGVDLKPETVGRLAEIPGVIGIKDACGDVDRVTALRERVPESFMILSGEDAQTLRMMELGAVGTISVTANVAPRQMAEFCSAFLNGDVARARELDAALQPLHEILFAETNPTPVKWALHEMGLIGPGIRLPLLPLSAAHRPELVRRLRNLEALT